MNFSLITALELNLFTFKVIDKYVLSDILLIAFLLFCSFSFYQFFSCFLCGLMTLKNDRLSFLFHSLFCIYYRFSASITVRGYIQGILILNTFSLTFKFIWCAVFILLLSHFSRVRLYVTPEMAAHQSPSSLGFSRQEYWSGVPLPSPQQVHQTTSEQKFLSWRRLLRVPWTARSSNQPILKEISPGCSLEGRMLKLTLQYFGH